MKDQHLHGAIREQGGAYGALASFNGSSGVIAFASYRDPRLQATYQDIESACKSLQQDAVNPDGLHAAILGRVAQMDSPSSPSGEARRRFIADITGFGPAIVAPYRQQVIQTTADDIQAAAQRWLDMSAFRRAVLTSSDMVSKEGLAWPSIDVNSLR